MSLFDATAYLALPPPISANNLFANVAGRGRVVTKEYRAWKKAAEQMLSAQAPLPHFLGPVDITYFVGEHGIGNMDVGNAEKAVTDALVTAGVLKDDSRKWVRAISLVWTARLGGVIACLDPAELSPQAATIAARVRQRDLVEVRR